MGHLDETLTATTAQVVTHEPSRILRPAEDTDELIAEALLRLEASDLVLIEALGSDDRNGLRDAGEHAIAMHGHARRLLTACWSVAA